MVFKKLQNVFIAHWLRTSALNDVFLMLINFFVRQDNDAKSGLTVDEVTAKVLKSIEAKFPPSCLRSLRIIIQALAAEGKHFGFSANGNLLHIAKNDFPSTFVVNVFEFVNCINFSLFLILDEKHIFGSVLVYCAAFS